MLMTWNERVNLLNRLWSGNEREARNALDELWAMETPLFDGPEEFDRAVMEVLKEKATRR